MTTFVDASVIVAILGDESDRDDYAARLRDADGPIISAVAIWEATVILARKLNRPLPVASLMVHDLLEAAETRIVDIGVKEADIAVQSFTQFGKGQGHPAKLNMGDCFAYACAKAHGAKLLYKGDDFSHTDLA